MINIRHALYFQDLYKRKALSCRDILNGHGQSLKAAGRSLTDQISLKLSEQYQLWLSALYDIQCLLISEGLEIDSTKMPVLKETPCKSNLAYDQRQDKLKQMLRLSEKDRINS